MSQEKYSSDKVFDKWIGWLTTEAQEMRYTYKGQGDVIDSLVNMLKANGTSMEDASMLERQVMMALTTPEGRKGAGKYKGWKENVQETFKGIVANYYVQIDELDEEEDHRVKADYANTKAHFEATKHDKFRYHEHDERIAVWVRKKFGTASTKALIKEAHLVFGILNVQWQVETFG